MAKNTDRGAEHSINRVNPPTGKIRGNKSIITNLSTNLKAYANTDLTAGTAFGDSGLAGYGDDYFNGWYAQFVVNNVGTSLLTGGNTRRISDSTDAGVLTFDTFGSDFVQGDEFILAPSLEAFGGDGWVPETVAITMAAGTTGSIDEHEVLTVTGLCEIEIVVHCTTNIAGGGSVQLGVGGATDALIGSTNGTDLDATDLWYDTTPTTAYAITGDTKFSLITDGLDVGYEISAGTLTSGVLKFEMKWKPLEDGAYCLAAAGAAGAI